MACSATDSELRLAAHQTMGLLIESFEAPAVGLLRERHALHVWAALHGVISLAEQGLLTGVVAEPDIERLWEALEADPGATVTVDLVNRTATCGPLAVPFDIDDYTRWRLLEGLDDIGLTLRHVEEVDAFERARAAWLPTTLDRVR